jgi:protein gp37
MAQSNIEWTELTWNPVTGCTKISPGCKFCYAEVMSKRLKAMGAEKYKDGFKIRTHTDSLSIPYSWKKPKVVFVNSMSDLFHPEVPFEFIAAVFAVMNNTPQHTYQVLTKRSERLRELAPQLKWTSNIWMGVSVENDEYAYRVNDLSFTPAITKFISVEPLIGAVTTLNLDNINWVIVGGESGHKARPLEKVWVDFIKVQCEERNIPFFFKQWGKPKFNIDPSDPTIQSDHPQHAKGGCQLDGKIYRQLPKYAA